MRIKKIELKGFRSFSEGTVAALSPGMNIIVGPNGSGKSTVVSALEFVLTRNNVRLSGPFRRSFICNVPIRSKGGQQHTTAEVTVWLDNEDGHFPLAEKEVAIRRQVSAASDQYFVNGRPTKVDQFLALMETSGFSPNNSHFLVQQGFVKEVAFGSQEAMLNILRAVSGAETFEERKGRAFALIDESERTITRLDGQIAFLHRQMRLFKIDRTVVAAFQEQTRLRRYLTGRLAHLDSEKAQAEAGRLKEEGRRLGGQLAAGEQSLAALRETLEANGAALKAAKAEEVTGKAKLALLESLMGKNRQLMARLQETLAGAEELSAEVVEELPRKKAVKARKLAQLEELKARLTAADQAIADLETAIAETEAANERMVLLGKVVAEGGGHREERVRRLIAQLRAEERRQRAYLGEQQQKLEEIRALGSSQESSTDALETEIRALKSKVCSLKVEKNKFEMERQVTIGKLSALQRDQLATEGTLKQLTTRLNVYSGNGAAVGSRKVMHALVTWCQRQLREMDEENGSDAEMLTEDEDEVRASRRLELQSIIEGYHGQIIDLVALDETLSAEARAAAYLAIEALLGSKIFQHVVASDSVARTILHYLDRLRADEGWDVSCAFRFLCLDKAEEAMEREDPTILASAAEDTAEVKPLLSYFTLLKEGVAPALHYLTRRLFVVRSFELAGELHQRHRGAEFATLQGDKIDRNGVICFAQERKSGTKLQLAEQFKATLRRLHEGTARLGALEAEYGELNRGVERCCREAGQAEAAIGKKREALNRLDQYRRGAVREERQATLGAEIGAAEQALARLAEEIAFWSGQLEEPADEADIEVQSFSQAEALSKLKQELAEAKKKRVALLGDRQRLTAEVTRLGKVISALLLEKLKMDSWSSSGGSAVGGGGSTSSSGQEDLAKQLADCEATDRRHREKAAEQREALARLRERLAALTEEREKAEEELVGVERTVGEVRQRRRQLAEQLRELEEKATALEREAENLGAVDGSAGMRREFARYARLGYAALSRALHQANAAISAQFSKGHRLSEAAVARFDELLGQVEELEGLRERSAANVIAIAEIVRVIEGRKTEIIDRTYKQVNRYLQEIFGQLVPGGTARLLFKMKAGAAGPHVSGSSASGAAQRAGQGRQTQQTRQSTGGGPSLNESASQSSSLTTQSSSLDLARKLLVSVPLDAASGERYVGMEILVSFTRGVEPHGVEALSGGQRTLVSLAFIFALQKVDPTPFYIFDEVDANLDEQKRADFANLVKRVADSEGRQFILTSFYRQTVEQGDKFYSVRNLNKLSTITPVEKEAALEFIETGSAAATHDAAAATFAANITGYSERGSVHHITANDDDDDVTREEEETAAAGTSAAAAAGARVGLMSPVIINEQQPMEEGVGTEEEEEEEAPEAPESENEEQQPEEDAAMDDAGEEEDEELEEAMSPEI